MFTQKDVREYYNITQIHYEKWWGLKNGLSLHYGIWDEGINSFLESLTNTNRVLMEICDISESDKILDAGCGVGGAAIYLSSNKNARVVGITLSEKQVEFAKRISIEKQLSNKTDFYLMDYRQTSFDDESFDVVWACESISSAPKKQDFIKEAYRVLKKGGRLVLSDFFLTDENQIDKHSWIKKWGRTWSISNFEPINHFVELLENQGFTIKKELDFTSKIYKSAKRMYKASFLGAIASELYNFFYPNVSRFAKNHYKTGYYQYKALKENLWQYHIILALK